MKFRATLQGAKALSRNMLGSTKKYKKALGAALYQEGQKIMGKSFIYCPKDTSTLARSRYVAPPKNINNPYVELGYGTDYAVIVHERQNPGIVYTTAGTGAKYLQRPIEEASRGYVGRIASRAAKNYRMGILMGFEGAHPKRPKKV